MPCEGGVKTFAILGATLAAGNGGWLRGGALTTEDLIINAAYVVSMAALAVRDVLRLRVFLLGAQALFLLWGVALWHYPTMGWNAAFLAINAFAIVRIFRERKPVELPAAFRDVHERLFSSMGNREFLLFWELGNPHRQTAGPLVRQGERPDALKLLLEGEARVERDGDVVATLSRGDFVAEMSLLSGEPASANVFVDEPVAFVSWSRRKLDALERLSPDVFLELQKALGRNVTAKVMAVPVVSADPMVRR